MPSSTRTPFEPHRDEDASIRFLLNVIEADRDFGSLADILALDSSADSIGGEPGWSLERRVVSETAAMAERPWPANAQFRAYVEPTGYLLRHPELFMDRSTLCRYVEATVNDYLELHPDQRSDPDIQSVLRLIHVP